MQKLKAQGVKLGSARPGFWDNRDRKWGKCVKAAAKARSSRTKDFYAFVTSRIIKMHDEEDLGWTDIAEILNNEGLTAQSGKPYSDVTVYRVYKRAEKEGAA